MTFVSSNFRLRKRELEMVSARKNADWLYSYDGLQRLKDSERGTLNGTHDRITNPQFAQCWTLDETGNWRGFRQSDDGSDWTLVQQRTANKVNEITNINDSTGPAWATPGYDQNGNMTTIPRPDAAPGPSWSKLSAGGWGDLTADGWGAMTVDPATFTATYDAWNRLMKVAGAEGTVQENQYDARNFRIVRKDYANGTLSQTRHCYFTNSWQNVEERLGTSTTPDQQNVWGVRYIDDLLLRDRSVDETLDERFYACQDANWNVTAVVGTDSAVKERYQYDPYGNTTFLAPDFTARSTTDYAWTALFTGRHLDYVTLFYDFRNRPYLAWLGAFPTRDPVGFKGGINTYQYCYSSPLSLLDPLGQTPQETALTGVPKEGCDDICGPDVTKWFVKDLRDHFNRLQGANPLTWQYNAKYNMSYKWMNFSAPGCCTGKCKNTVMFSGICIRKNQLGNIAFGFISRMRPPFPVATNSRPPFPETHPIAAGYNLGSTYSPGHPYSANFGNFAGVNRADNLAAFSLGYNLGSPPGFDIPIFNPNQDQVNAFLSLASGTDGGYQNYTSIYGPDARNKITKDTFTFVPEYGGFNTQSCKPCNATYDNPGSSKDGFESIKNIFNNMGQGTSLDDWLKNTFEDYTADYPTF